MYKLIISDVLADVLQTLSRHFWLNSLFYAIYGSDLGGIQVHKNDVMVNISQSLTGDFHITIHDSLVDFFHILRILSRYFSRKRYFLLFSGQLRRGLQVQTNRPPGTPKGQPSEGDRGDRKMENGKWKIQNFFRLKSKIAKQLLRLKIGTNLHPMALHHRKDNIFDFRIFSLCFAI